MPASRFILGVRQVLEKRPWLCTLPTFSTNLRLLFYDLTIPQHKNHDQPKETLQIADGNFMYVVDIPLTEFDNQLTLNQLHDPTLQSYVLLKNVSWEVDVGDIVRNGTGEPPLQATSISILVSQDIVDKIGIDQDIIINGFSSLY